MRGEKNTIIAEISITAEKTFYYYYYFSLILAEHFSLSSPKHFAEFQKTGSRFSELEQRCPRLQAPNRCPDEALHFGGSTWKWLLLESKQWGKMNEEGRKEVSETNCSATRALTAI